VAFSFIQPQETERFVRVVTKGVSHIYFAGKGWRKQTMNNPTDLQLLITFFTEDKYYTSKRIIDNLNDEDKMRLFDLLIKFGENKAKLNNGE